MDDMDDMDIRLMWDIWKRICVHDPRLGDVKSTDHVMHITHLAEKIILTMQVLSDILNCQEGS